MSVSDRLGGLSTDGFAKLTNSQPIHHARSTHLDHTTPIPRSYAISLFEFPDPSASRNLVVAGTQFWQIKAQI
jgi:hypothetical protein